LQVLAGERYIFRIHPHGKSHPQHTYLQQTLTVFFHGGDAGCSRGTPRFLSGLLTFVKNIHGPSPPAYIPNFVIDPGSGQSAPVWCFAGSCHY